MSKQINLLTSDSNLQAGGAFSLSGRDGRSRRPSLRRLFGGSPPDRREAEVPSGRCNVEACNEHRISGWAFHQSGIKEIRVFREDILVGRATLGLDRPDVGQAFPDVPHGDRSGFVFLIGQNLGAGLNRITLEIEAGDGTSTTITREIVSLGADGRRLPRRFRVGIDRPARSGLPYEVTELLRSFRPGIYDGQSCWDDDLMARAVGDIGAIWKSEARADALNQYILFLETMYHRFLRVASRFPKINEQAAYHAKDTGAMGTTPEEMLAIANHLFVLRSNGLDGRLLEFGCFKGFSSSCLSYCCRALDLPMEIFDSFAGLPPSSGGYYGAGEFCGTLDEVRENIATFGEIDAVRFHQGFFADTLPYFDQGPILSIWMDVDLRGSAEDVARILDRLPRSSVVFTHEFPPDGAADGRVLAERSEVFPPILDRFESLGRIPTGRYLGGCLGAIWDAHEGIPIIPQHLLMELVHLAT